MGDLESLHVPPVVMEQAGSSLLLGSTPAAGLVVGSPVTPGMTMLPASLASALAAVPSHATPPSTPVLLPTPDAGKVRPIQPYAVAPGMTLTADTYSIPVNANRSSGSVWKKDGSGAELKGIPAVRDFDLNPMRDLTGWDGTGNPPAGPAAADPDVKKMTATVILPQVVNVITVNVIYANANTGGRVRLWTDPTKTTEITNGGTLPGYPSSDFYVEGLTPSAAENDITVRVRSTQLNVTVIAERQLTVVPFQVSMSVQPTANPATVTLLKDGSGQVVGLNSGQQAVNGGAFNGTRPGADFSSYVWRDGATGLPKLIQNVLNVSSVAP